MEHLSSNEKLDMKKRLEKFIIQDSFTHEYQVLCKEMEEKVGRVVWKLPYLPYVTDEKLRRAWEIAKKKGIYKIGYLIGILKKL